MLITNGLLVIVTGVYVLLTYGLLRESQKTRLAMMRSEIIAEIVDEGPSFFLVIRNIGRSPARDISLKFDPTLTNHRDQDLSLSMVGLGPNELRKYYIESGPNYFNKQKPLIYYVRITWTDLSGNRDTRSYSIDMESYRHVHAGSNPEEQFRNDLLNKLQSIVQKISEISQPEQ